jgi:hypothetical protein
MPLDPLAEAAIAAAAQRALELGVPVLLPFDSLLTVVRNIIVAHFNSTGQIPNNDEIKAQLPIDWAAFEATWAKWTPSGDGTLK